MDLMTLQKDDFVTVEELSARGDDAIVEWLINFIKF
jgi:hypothetical protein